MISAALRLPAELSVLNSEQLLYSTVQYTSSTHTNREPVQYDSTSLKYGDNRDATVTIRTCETRGTEKFIFTDSKKPSTELSSGHSKTFPENQFSSKHMNFTTTPSGGKLSSSYSIPPVYSPSVVQYTTPSLQYSTGQSGMMSYTGSPGNFTHYSLVDSASGGEFPPPGGEFPPTGDEFPPSGGEFPPPGYRGVPQPALSVADGCIIAFMFSLWGYSIYLTYRSGLPLLYTLSVSVPLLYPYCTPTVLLLFPAQGAWGLAGPFISSGQGQLKYRSRIEN